MRDFIFNQGGGGTGGRGRRTKATERRQCHVVSSNIEYVHLSDKYPDCVNLTVQEDWPFGHCLPAAAAYGKSGGGAPVRVGAQIMRGLKYNRWV